MLSSRDRSTLINNAKKSAYRRFIKENRLFSDDKPLPFKSLTYDQKLSAEKMYLYEILTKKLKTSEGHTATFLNHEIKKLTSAEVKAAAEKRLRRTGCS